MADHPETAAVDDISDVRTCALLDAVACIKVRRKKARDMAAMGPRDKLDLWAHADTELMMAIGDLERLAIDTAKRRRTIWSRHEQRYVTFSWVPDPACPICHGKGMADQYRTYGDPQHHGHYYENCDRCSAPPIEEIKNDQAA